MEILCVREIAYNVVRDETSCVRSSRVAGCAAHTRNEGVVDRRRYLLHKHVTRENRIEANADEWVGKKYRQSVAVQPLIELALGLYFTWTVFYALANQIYGTVPFLLLFQIGFLYTGVVSIVQQYAGESGVVAPSLEKRTASGS